MGETTIVSFGDIVQTSSYARSWGSLGGIGETTIAFFGGISEKYNSSNVNMGFILFFSYSHDIVLILFYIVPSTFRKFVRFLRSWQHLLSSQDNYQYHTYSNLF